jgi:hypothetical protein
MEQREVENFFLKEVGSRALACCRTGFIFYEISLR